MSHLAMHEKREGKENKKIGTYFRSDYISLRAVRYRKARTRLKVYFNNLRRLQILYQRERKEKRQ